MARNIKYKLVLYSFLLTYSASEGKSVGRRSDHPIRKPANGNKAALTEDFDFWMANGESSITESVNHYDSLNTKHAKNIILFIGDGMSIATVTAARIYKAQQYENNFVNPESQSLTFELFPNVGLSKTYDIDAQTPDSAATATAMFAGIKTKQGSMGYDESIDRSNVSSMATAREVDTILTWAQDAGMDTGFVTTARVTHATPGALYAHSYDRYWEGDCEGEGPEGDEVAPEGKYDIAWQLINTAPGNKAKVILGGGYPMFFGEDQSDLHADIDFAEDEDCFRRDNLDLTQQWLDEHGSKAKFVMTEDELIAIDTSKTDYLFGLVGGSHVAFNHERTPGIDPTLPDMTETAIKMVNKGDNGFFLMIESGRIDHAHHVNTANRALEETVQLDFAVERALELLKDQLDETLIIVTADHSHLMSMSGYNDRGVDIRGINSDSLDDELPYLSLNYGNGPGFDTNFHVVEGKVERVNLTDKDYTAPDFVQAAWGPDDLAKHGGDDVAIYARGPMSHLFHKVHEQTHVAHVMAYSACIGPYAESTDRCLNKENTESPQPSGSGSLSVEFVLVAAFIFSILINI